MTVPAALKPTSDPPAPRKRRRSVRRPRLFGGLAGVFVAVVASGLVLWVSHVFDRGARRTANNVPVSWQRPVVTADGLVQQSGVKITQVVLTGDGGLVDLRFKVVDPERANAVHDPTTPPAVVDEESAPALPHR